MSVQAAEFQFQTKAKNLLQLAGRLEYSTVCDIELLTVGEWHSARAECVSRVQRRFAGTRVIVRSSTTDEDTADESMAGAFDSVANVDSSDATALGDAIDAVADSYVAKGVDQLAPQEVLIQPMVADVVLSGVLFTRDLERNLPYYVVNYEESDRTDSITAGTTSALQRVYRIYRGTEPEALDHPLDTIITAAREVETVTAATSLDIEFAVDAWGRFYLLQVRPLVRTQLMSHALVDRRLASQIHAMREFVRARFQPRDGLWGATTVLGEMPDWNPAEIIGTRPTPLASSLYRYLIMNSVWRESRGELGYRDPAPHHLLVDVAGRPYVDVRCSVNSLIPTGLSDSTGQKLVDYYLDRLRQHPEFHDKIEFEVVFTSHTFDVEAEHQQLRTAGFNDSQIDELWRLLFDLTNRAVVETDGRSERFEAAVDQLTRRRDALLATTDRVEALPFKIAYLLEDCRRLGTLPFSVAARCAFIASSFLRSLVSRGVLTEHGYHRYTNSIDTVATALVVDLDRLRAGDVAAEDFLASYGHLRPGTYDIRAFSYRDRPDEYLSLSGGAAGAVAEGSSGDTGAEHDLALADVTDVNAVAALIDEFGFGFDVPELDRFIKASIRQREWLKFEFSKNLSAALDLIATYARHHGMSRNDVAFVEIDELIGFANATASTEDLDALRRQVESRRKLHELTSTIPLPDLIFGVSDVEVVFDQRRKPNFVTQQTVTADVVHLRDASDVPDDDALAGKIVLIENADPGYDWLFSKSIAGLCTKYGGAASHMTIRCAEFGTPAAIGCGEQIFSELRSASSVRLDCEQQRVSAHGA